jgi:hypothetical protein
MKEWNIDRAQLSDLMVVDPTGKAGRADKGKLRYDLLPPKAIEDLVAVLSGGAAKYGDSNWRNDGGMAWSRCYASAMRHIQAWYQGENTDPESGLSHLAHAMCNLTFLLEYERTNQERDDRPFKVKP